MKIHSLLGFILPHPTLFRCKCPIIELVVPYPMGIPSHLHLQLDFLSFPCIVYNRVIPTNVHKRVLSVTPTQYPLNSSHD